MHVPDVMRYAKATHNFTSNPVVAVQCGEFRLSFIDCLFKG